MSLDDLRRRLDNLDDQVVDLLRQRADLAVEVGRIKREQGLDFYAGDKAFERGSGGHSCAGLSWMSATS